MQEKWHRPLQSANDPVATLIEIVRSTPLEPKVVQGGCPLNNLAQEMSGISESFRKRLTNIFSRWTEGIGESLRDGQDRGLVRKDLKPEDAATFLVATYEGYISLAKASQDSKLLRAGIANLVRYLESLRVVGCEENARS